MKALLYACTTAADLGQTVHDLKLPELRRHAASRGWEVAGEFTDAIPTGVGKRPGFNALCAALAAGAGNVVVTTSISDLAWDISTGLLRMKELGLGERCSLVCLRNGFDSTTPSGQLRLLDALALLAEHRKCRAHDRQVIGELRAIAQHNGMPFGGRPRLLLSVVEVRSMYERGLSQREMLALLSRAGAPVSKGKLAKAMVNFRQSGDIGEESEKLRAAALAKRGGLPRGGRPAKRKKAA